MARVSKRQLREIKQATVLWAIARKDATGRWPTEAELKAHARDITDADAKAIDWVALILAILEIIAKFKQ